MKRLPDILLRERPRQGHRRSAFPPLLVLLLSFGIACDSVEAPELTHPCVSWCNTVAPWPHDGAPYEGVNFTVYSDGASLEARKELADTAESVLAELQTRLGIGDDVEFIFPSGQNKIHLYTYKYHYQAEWGGQAFWGGMIIYSLDHLTLSKDGHHTERDFYRRLVTHEIMHVVQNLLVGSSHSYSTHTWFEEGLGEFVSALNPEYSVESLADLNAVVAKFGELNPITIHDDILPPIPNVGVEYYYPMFELTLRYLVDARGLGRSLPNAKDVFLDMRDGMSFPDAFLVNFGIAVPDLEEEYFTRMREFLR